MTAQKYTKHGQRTTQTPKPISLETAGTPVQVKIFKKKPQSPVGCGSLRYTDTELTMYFGQNGPHFKLPVEL